MIWKIKYKGKNKNKKNKPIKLQRIKLYNQKYRVILYKHFKNKKSIEAKKKYTNII